MYSTISAIGSYLPSKILSNTDLEKLVNTSDDWIVDRTGIKTRHIAREDEFASDLAIQAINNLVERYSKTIDDVDFIFVATSTMDAFYPSVAVIIQNHFKIKKAGALDIGAACAGFAYGLILADSLIKTGVYKKILLIGSEVLSKTVDYTDRNSCILFGDGAAAVLIEPSSEPGIIANFCSTEGQYGQDLYRSAVANKINNTKILHDGLIHQNGKVVFKWAVTNVPLGIKEILKMTGRTLDDIDWIVTHSANLRIIEGVCNELKFPIDKTLKSIREYGNTSSASIPLSIDQGVIAGKLKKGDTMIVYGFGGGLTQAGLLLKWNI